MSAAKRGVPKPGFAFGEADAGRHWSHVAPFLAGERQRGADFWARTWSLPAAQRRHAIASGTAR